MSTSFESASLVAVPCVGSARQTREIIVENALQWRPQLVGTLGTAFGSIGVILIPIVDMELFDDTSQTVKAVLAGIELAAQGGARWVSCTGMIPASTAGLRTVQDAIKATDPSQLSPDLKLTTGHETVTAAFLLNIERICREAGRDLNQERMTVVGLGHIGSAVLELLFRLNYRPSSLHLVDVTTKKEALCRLRDQLLDRYGYRGTVEISTVPKSAGIPTHLYDETTFILGACSSADVIDVDRMRPGTVLVDDSFPLGFDAPKAIRRIEQANDILITIAGGLASSNPINPRRWFSTDHELANLLISGLAEAANFDDRSLTGCVYSSVLTGHFALPYSLGDVQPDHALAHYKRYSENGFHGTPIYIMNTAPVAEGSAAYSASTATLESFRRRFSHSARK